MRRVGRTIQMYKTSRYVLQSGKYQFEEYIGLAKVSSQKQSRRLNNDYRDKLGHLVVREEIK